VKVKLASSKRSQTATTLGIDDAVALVRSSFADHQVERQTIALLDHLAERLKIAEANQATLIGVLQAVADDSFSSKEALLDAINGISERLVEKPEINVTLAKQSGTRKVTMPDGREVKIEDGKKVTFSDGSVATIEEE
jgi:hypothetical protein